MHKEDFGLRISDFGSGLLWSWVGIFPSLAKEGRLRDQENFREATLARADGVVRSSHRLTGS